MDDNTTAARYTHVD